MLLERRVVSRKTPGDGRLEITRRVAERLGELGSGLDVEWNGQRGWATVQSMSCTCRGEDKPHAHYFLQSEAFARLTPGTELDLELDEDAGMIRLRDRR
jgi:hypothetical protein